MSKLDMHVTAKIIIKKLNARIAQLEAENERLRELMSEAVLDDWFIQQEPDFEKRWNKALEPDDE